LLPVAFAYVPGDDGEGLGKGFVFAEPRVWSQPVFDRRYPVERIPKELSRVL
jgi:hypothetical protein